MSTDLGIDIEQLANGLDDDEYHHHVRTTHERILKALDHCLVMRALCGLEKPPQQNALARPCCPLCNSLLKKPCASEEFKGHHL